MFRNGDGLADGTDGIGCIYEFGIVFIDESLHGGIEETDGLS